MKIVLKIFFIILIIHSTLAFCEEKNAVYNYKIWKCQVTKKGFVEKIKKKITIFNQRGDYYNQIFLSKSPFSTLEKVKCTVYDSKGKKVYSRTKKDMVKQKGFGASFELYNDNTVYSIQLLPPEYPYSIEITYEKKYKSLFFWRGADIIENIPVEKFEYELQIDSHLKFNYQTPKLLESPTIIDKGKKLIYSWRAENISAIDYNNFDPQEGLRTSLKIVPYQFSFNKINIDSLSWKNIGLWYKELSSNQYRFLSDKTDSLNLMEYVKQEYEELISSTHYVAVSIGVSGWQPADASTTLECGYGDCKGLSTLLISKVKNNHVDIFPVLVLTRQVGSIDPEFPEMGFNHLITMAVIGNDTLWMDPTCTICPFGELPWVDENINMLVVTDTGGVLIKSPVSSSDENQIISKTHLLIHSENYAEINLRITIKGNIAQRFRSIFSNLDKSDIINYIKKELLSNKNHYNKLKWKHGENNSDINKPFVLEINANILNPIKKFSNELFVQPPFLSYEVFERIGNMKEEKSISFQYPKSVIDSITIKWADELRVDSVLLPQDNFVDCSIGNANFSYSKNKQSINIVAESHVTDYYLHSTQMTSYKEFLQSFTSVLKQKIVFISEN